MFNAFTTLIFWICGIIALSFIVIVVLYKMAMILAVMAVLGVIGFLVGVPLVLAGKYRYKKYIREEQKRQEEAEKEAFYYKNFCTGDRQ
jgi:uncharacterized membrane protein YqjE